MRIPVIHYIYKEYMDVQKYTKVYKVIHVHIVFFFFLVKWGGKTPNKRDKLTNKNQPGPRHP